jgi:hypothetical protein
VRAGPRLLLAALLLALAAGPARARSASILPYPVAEVWSSGVRFVRVDRGYTLREKDQASGYILFELSEGGKSYKGALELVRATDEDGRDATRASFSLPDLPRHWEAMLLDKLAAKVREERGPPAPPPPRKKPEERRPIDAAAPEPAR